MVDVGPDRFVCRSWIPSTCATLKIVLSSRQAMASDRAIIGVTRDNWLPRGSLAVDSHHHISDP